MESRSPTWNDLPRPGRSEPSILSRLSLAALATGLTQACLPSGPIIWLPLLAWAPLFLALRGAGPASGLLVGGAYGFVNWLAATWWVQNGLVEMLAWDGVMVWSGTVLFSLFQGSPYALFGLLVGWMGKRGRTAGPYFSAALLTLLIFLRPDVCPASPSVSLYAWPLAIQIADLGGAHLVLLFLLLSNALLAEAVARYRTPARAVRPLFCAALLVSSVLGYGTLRVHQLRALAGSADSEAFLTVRAVQPDVPVTDRDHNRSADALDILVRATREAANRFEDADLVLWPEVPQHFPCDCERFEERGVFRAAMESGGTLVLACVEYDYADEPLVSEIRVREGGGTVNLSRRRIAAVYNAAWRVGPDGACGSAYRKSVLVPFGERTPLREAWPFMDRIARTLEYSPGPGPALVTLPGGRRVQPLICYESGFPHLAREGVRLGAEAFVNLVDDAWFDSARAAELHLSIALFRAVEQRRPLIRCTNSGFGAHVAATGEIASGTLTPAWSTSVVQASLHTPRTVSPYFHLQDRWLWPVALLVLFVLSGSVSSRPGVH
jgi:apolipoprotein N-acyltransferase